MMRSSSDEASDKSSKDSRSLSLKGMLKESKSKDREKKQHSSLKTTSSSSRSRSRHAHEMISYEERRAKRKYYNLYSSDNNFNLLERQKSIQDEENHDDREESCVVMDESSSIEEVDMEEETPDGIMMLRNLNIDENEPPVMHRPNNLLNVTTFDEKKTALNVTTLHGTVSDSAAKRANPRKVLFDVNTSVDSKSFISATNNVSTNSSVLNETDAVHEREETVNTKFAARELSMMFASPGALNGSLNNSRHDTKSRNQVDSDRLLFSIHRNNEQDTNDSNAELDKMLSIYCDPECDKENKGVFKIFEEAPMDMKDGMTKASGLKTQYEIDEDSNSDSDSDSGLRSEDRGTGDTASYSDIMALLQNTNDNRMEDKQSKEGAMLEIYCDNQNERHNNEGNKSFCCEIEDGTVLNEDDAAFGDISFIPYKDNTIDLQGRMRQMKLTDQF